MAIVVADDDLLSVKLTSYLLEESGYSVIRVYDAPDVLQTVEQHNPDLVLLDVCMPRLNGLDVCRLIRRVSDVPIIFLSARAQLEDRVAGLQAGGDDYVVKPFEPAELLARIEAILRRRNSDLLRPLERLARGDVTLDPVELRVSCTDGRSVILTPVEFRLLYYLMKNAGRILSGSQILSKVWGYDYGPGSNLVAVYVRRVRAKIEQDPDHPRHVITIPSLGYKFDS